jgi:hypothetical protein
MVWFIGQALLVAACLIVTTLVGRALTGALGGCQGGDHGGEDVASAALAGTAVLALCFGWLSYAGMPGRFAAPIIIVSFLVALGLATWRAGPRLLLPPRSGVAVWSLAGLAFAAALLSLLPLLIGDFFNAMNDTFIRLVISDYLQDHGFFEAVRQAQFQPALSVMTQYQTGGFRMGGNFLLAFVQALTPGLRAIDVYPAVSAWGVALNVLGLFLLARWGLGLALASALLGAGLMAIAPSAMHTAAAGGFLPQTYGTAALSFSLAALARAAQSTTFDRARGGLLGIAAAFLISAYSELFPFFVISAGVTLGWLALRRGRSAGSAYLTCLAAAGIWLLLANIEVARALRAIPIQMGAMVGSPVRWPPLEFWAFALGVRLGGRMLIQLPPPPWLTGLTIVASLALMAGLVKAARRGNSYPTLAALLAFAALAGYYAFIARDPWSGATGHTWSLYKLAQWAFPILLALQCAGLDWLMRRRYGSLALGGAAALALMPALSAQVTLARDRVETMQQRARSNHPLQAYRELALAVDGYQPDLVYLVDKRGSAWPRVLLTYFLFPRPVASDWRATAYLGPSRLANREVAFARPERPLYLVVGQPRFGCYQDLPGGVARVESDLTVLSAQSQSRVERRGAKQLYWLDQAGLTLHVWSAREASARLVLRVTPGTVRGQPRLAVRTVAGYEGEVRSGDFSALEAEVPLEPGANVITFVTADASSGSGTARRYLAVEDVRASFVGVDTLSPTCFSDGSDGRDNQGDDLD